MIDGIVAVALEKQAAIPPAIPSSARAQCGPNLLRPPCGPSQRRSHRFFVAREYVVLDDEAAEITTAGTRFFTEFGIELPALRSTRRHFCRLCLDWTERRPHIAGAIGAAITKRYFDLGWMERMKRSHAVIVTAVGTAGLPGDLRHRRVDASLTARSVPRIADRPSGRGFESGTTRGMNARRWPCSRGKRASRRSTSRRSRTTCAKRSRNSASSGARRSIPTSSTRATRRSSAPRRRCGPPSSKRRSACPVTLRALLNRRVASWNGCEF